MNTQAKFRSIATALAISITTPMAAYGADAAGTAGATGAVGGSTMGGSLGATGSLGTPAVGVLPGAPSTPQGVIGTQPSPSMRPGVIGTAPGVAGSQVGGGVGTQPGLIGIPSTVNDPAMVPTDPNVSADVIVRERQRREAQIRNQQ
jgi:hypothetical protein